MRREKRLHEDTHDDYQAIFSIRKETRMGLIVSKYYLALERVERLNLTQLN